MTTFPSRHLRAWTLGSALAAALAPGCLSHEEILTGSEVGASGGTGATSSGGALVGEGGTSSGGTLGVGGTLGAGGTSPDSPSGVGGASACSTDKQCPEQEWCRSGRCGPCPGATSCPEGWVTVPRHGCDWCVPSSDCRSDAECGDGRCYPGRACLPGCEPGDPACCHGNLCDVEGCGGTESIDCLLVGCPEGSSCVGDGIAPASCGCDASTGAWLCSDASDRVCQ